MPLPLIIGAIAGAADNLGAGAGIYGASKIMEANEIKESAKKRKEKKRLLNCRKIKNLN